MVSPLGVGSRVTIKGPENTNVDLDTDPLRQLAELTTTIAKAAPGDLG